MKVKIDEDNHLILDPKLGGRILQLKLAGKIIISSSDPGTGNGSYLMYPWVNRVQNLPYKHIHNPFNDANSIPIHGLYVNSPRLVQQFPISDKSIGIKCTPSVTFPEVPQFTETFILAPNRLQVKIQSHKKEQKFPICFGYHPFLQIGEEYITECQIKTDIKTNLKLDEKLLPVYPYIREEIDIKSSQEYDSLFEGGSFFELNNKQGFHVKLSSTLPYWQIYTPPDRKRIAVEPMSFTGNIFAICEKGQSPKLQEGEFEINVWKDK